MNSNIMKKKPYSDGQQFHYYRQRNNHLSLQLVALHLTTYFQVMDWNKHKHEVSLMDITIAGSINACS